MYTPVGNSPAACIYFYCSGRIHGKVGFECSYIARLATREPWREGREGGTIFSGYTLFQPGPTKNIYRHARTIAARRVRRLYLPKDCIYLKPFGVAKQMHSAQIYATLLQKQVYWTVKKFSVFKSSSTPTIIKLQHNIQAGPGTRGYSLQRGSWT